MDNPVRYTQMTSVGSNVQRCVAIGQHSANIATALRAKGLSPAIRYAAAHWTKYFPAERLAQG